MNIEVVKGDPTPEELAALIAVITTRAAASPEQPERASSWASYWREVHAPPQHGPGRWRASAHPR